MQRRALLRAGLTASLAASIAALAACSSMSSSETGWVTLLDGKSLSGWNQIGNGNWRAEDGLVIGDKGKAGFLVTPRTYQDFMIRAEFWASDDANSGVFLRGSDPTKVDGKNAYEVNIFDKRPDPTYGTGAIVYVAPPLVPVKAGGHWNIFEITAKGPALTVTLNGVKTIDGVRDTAHASGIIALQSDGGVVKFRKVEIKEING